MEFNCAELLSFSHKNNLWGDALQPNATQSFTIRGRINGDYTQESIENIWIAMNNMIVEASGQSIPIIINSVNVGTGRITSLDFAKGTDVYYKEYTASFEVQRHAGSGMYENTGNLVLNTTYFTGQPSVYSLFNEPEGRYILEFQESFDLSQIAKEKYEYTKDVSFTIDEAILPDLGIDPAVFAKTIMDYARSSYGDINVVTQFYPNFYKNQSGILSTTQVYDDIHLEGTYNEKFTFQSGLNYKWDYNYNISLADGVVSVAENGVITSTQQLAYKSKAAELAWATIETGIFARATAVYDNYTGVWSYTGGCSLKNLPENSTLSKNGCEGTIEYSKTYSNSPFNNSGYVYSYEDNIDQDPDGYLTLSERGTIQAIPSAYPTGFSIAYMTYLSKSGEIQSRMDSFYADYTGNFYQCYLGASLGVTEEELTLQEHAGIVSYTKKYSDNPRDVGNGTFSKISNTISIDEPTHVVNYFPISYDHVIAQPALQSLRGVFTNNISLVSRTDIPLSQFLNTATGMIQFPEGDDIYMKGYSYQFSPLTRAFSLTASYSYEAYITSSQILV